MYKKVSTDMNFTEREKEILSFWKENTDSRKILMNRWFTWIYDLMESILASPRQWETSSSFNDVFCSKYIVNQCLNM